MEIIDVTLTPLQRRNRAVFLAQDVLERQLAAEGREVRALEPGEKVVVHAETEFYAGTVIDKVSSETYLITLGVRMPAEWAFRRAGREVPENVETSEQPTAQDAARTQGLLDLLGDLRTEGGVSARATTQATTRRKAHSSD